MPKRLELLTELVPQARVIALLVEPEQPESRGCHITDYREAIAADEEVISWGLVFGLEVMLENSRDRAVRVRC